MLQTKCPAWTMCALGEATKSHEPYALSSQNRSSIDQNMQPKVATIASWTSLALKARRTLVSLRNFNFYREILLPLIHYHLP